MQVTIDGVQYAPACLTSSRIGIAIAGMLVDADRVCGDHIVMNKLIHGVCYSPPQGRVGRMLSAWNKTLAADYAVGKAFGGRVIYPCYSLVDHADGVSVEKHPDRQPRLERRRAWRLYG